MEGKIDGALPMESDDAGEASAGVAPRYAADRIEYQVHQGGSLSKQGDAQRKWRQQLEGIEYQRLAHFMDERRIHSEAKHDALVSC